MYFLIPASIFDTRGYEWTDLKAFLFGVAQGKRCGTLELLVLETVNFLLQGQISVVNLTGNFWKFKIAHYFTLDSKNFNFSSKLLLIQIPTKFQINRKNVLQQLSDTKVGIKIKLDFFYLETFKKGSKLFQ